ADGQHGRPVTHNGIDEVDPELSPDNRTVLFLADANARQEPYYTTNVFVVPAAGGTPQLIVPDFPYSIDQATWMPDGKNVLAAVNMGVHSEVFLLDVDAHRARQLTDGRHFITPGSLSIVPAAETIVMQLDEPTRFGDVWTLPLRGASPARPPTRVTDLFDRMEREVALPRQEKVEWKSTDGTTIEGVLFYPIDYVPGRRYPLIVQMHGGPGDSDKFGAGVGLLDRYFPVSTAKGYAVLRPNYRGSSGYGNAFYRAIIGDYFTRQAEDILSGIDHLVQAGVVDPDRLIATGWSAGGHLTNKLITMTSRFKAASSGAGVANWISLYAQTDTRVDRTVWFGGTPWQKDAPIAAYWNNSPLKDVANVRTPTLFFVGVSDPRVPKEQSIEMYRALKSNGVPTALYIAPHEPHQWGGLHHLLDKANHELEWFDKYALGRAYLPEKAPDKK
ncbi:MAG TPA: prolyl oligopeptidase family serine peptidase, partial [Vicinamibacterales bacterium]|nr:prolyl oligopeptidase family serine peptidase [Vicinamibacterales bacterium]